MATNVGSIRFTIGRPHRAPRQTVAALEREQELRLPEEIDGDEYTVVSGERTRVEGRAPHHTRRR